MHRHVSREASLPPSDVGFSRVSIIAAPLPFESPAPERGGRALMYSLLPEDLAKMGHSGSAEILFGKIQRVDTWLEGAPSLGKKSRALLAQFTEDSLPRVEAVHASQDGSSRLVLRTDDGHRFETVHMPRNTKNPRVTLCLSSQVGCAMGCTFCATGTMGIVRNLSAGEIVGQVLVTLRELGACTGHHLNLVFMGMGEPLHNLSQVQKALEILCHPAGLGISPRRITVSTSGLVTGIEKLANTSPRPLLAVSVNHTTDEARAKVMPVNRKFPLSRLKQTLRDWPLRNKERITLEYVLLEGENDTDEDASRLAAFASDLTCHINLIPMNEHSRSDFLRPDDSNVQRFARALLAQGCLVFVRDSRGRDVAAACGQLVTGSTRGARKKLPIEDPST